MHPSDTETLGLNYAQADWNSGLQTKRVGKMYNDGTDLATGKIVVNEAFTIDPVVLTNLFVNYTIKQSGKLCEAVQSTVCGQQSVQQPQRRWRGWSCRKVARVQIRVRPIC